MSQAVLSYRRTLTEDRSRAMKNRRVIPLKAVVCLGRVWRHLSPTLVLVLLSLALQPHQTWAAPGRSVPSMPYLPSASSLSSAMSDSGSSRHRDSSGSQQPSDPLSRLSKVFGFSRIPRRVHHRSPPQYMQDLYSSITDTGGLSKASGPYNSNVIKSFPDKDSVHRMHFQYNVSSLEEDEQLLQAEFHLFKMRPGPGGSQRAMPRLPHVILIKVYQVMDSRGLSSSRYLRLLDARRVTSHGHGWYVFNVTQAVRDWSSGSKPNYGFLVTAETSPGIQVNGSQIRFAQRNEHHDSKQPILVTFTDSGEPRHSNYISPMDEDYEKIKEDISRREEQKHYRQTGSFRDRVRMLNERARNSRGSRRSKRSAGKNRGKGGRRKRTYEMYRYRNRRSCTRYEMFVDFEEIGWSGWIISPNSYNAYHCAGECPFPLGQSQKPTNHATVQSIVHALGVGKDVGTPCCVPNKLYSISLLYFDDNENVILKQYDDMVVASCGCH